tara:strand:+ start:373 stop:546 length:174 start_codon:yes stop_codon:yes gene_type:complete
MVDYSGIPNERDLKIKDAIKKFGKDEKGKYKNPTKLIETLPRAKGADDSLWEKGHRV